MTKPLFNRYVELIYYRLANQQLLNQKLITRAEYRTLNQQITQLETDLLVPKSSQLHRQRTLTVIK